jgi:hypothetical protein
MKFITRRLGISVAVGTLAFASTSTTAAAKPGHESCEEFGANVASRAMNLGRDFGATHPAWPRVNLVHFLTSWCIQSRTPRVTSQARRSGHLGLDRDCVRDASVVSRTGA